MEAYKRTHYPHGSGDESRDSSGQMTSHENPDEHASTKVPFEPIELAEQMLRQEFSENTNVPGRFTLGSFTNGAGDIKEIWLKRAESLVETLQSLLARESANLTNSQQQQSELIDLVGFDSEAAPGGCASVEVSLLSSHRTQQVHTRLSTGGLLSVSGHLIPAASISITPEICTLPAGGRCDAEISIQVPQGTREGEYSGILETDEKHPFRVLLSLRVKQTWPNVVR